MVCNRCRLVVESLLKEQGLHTVHIALGEVTIAENALPPAQKVALAAALAAVGFELIDDQATRTIEAIKALIIRLIHYTSEPPVQKYSELISAALHHDYSALSKLFSETEGITIEQYIILQKTERVKELLVYGELSLSQIAGQMGYSSTAHLSAQFKKVTGMTPTQFRQLRNKGRRPLDEVSPKLPKIL